MGFFKDVLRHHPNPYRGQKEHGLPLHQQELTPKLEAFKSTTSSFDPFDSLSPGCRHPSSPAGSLLVRVS